MLSGVTAVEVIALRRFSMNPTTAALENVGVASFQA